MSNNCSLSLFQPRPTITTSPSVSRTYMEGFTFHGLSKVFTGKLWERLYWFLILTGALGFVTYKVYGFHQQHTMNDFRTEIRMIDSESLTFPDIRFCSTNVRYTKGVSCYKNKSERGGPCITDYITMDNMVSYENFKKDLFSL